MLLIDCDMRNPTVHKNFNLSNKVGLSSCISIGTAVADAVQATGIEGLDALTAGVIPPNPSELLGSERMKNILQRARKSTIMYSSTRRRCCRLRMLGIGMVDGLILVIDSGEIKVEMAREVKNQLVHAGANIPGVVLNKVRS